MSALEPGEPGSISIEIEIELRHQRGDRSQNHRSNGTNKWGASSGAPLLFDLLVRYFFFGLFRWSWSTTTSTELKTTWPSPLTMTYTV